MDRLPKSGTTSQIALKRTIMKSIDERRQFNALLEIFLAEVIGTGLLMYVGCMGSFGTLSNGNPPPPMQGGLMFGFVVSSLIVAVGHISKAHFNPSVTLCAYLLGTISFCTAVVYFVAEIIGAILGFYFLTVTTPENLFLKFNKDNCTFCTTMLQADVDIHQGFLIEFIATSFLIFVVCSVWDPRNASTSDSVALKFGLLISALSICAGPFTGASLNPARTLAPALILGQWKDHWLYWVAPLSGSVITTTLYKYVFMRSLNTPNSEELSSHNHLDSIKERKALKDDSSDEKSLNIA